MRRSGSGWKSAAVGLALAACGLTGMRGARAQEFELTPLLGYRFGGGFEDVDGDPSVDIESDMSYGLILGWDIDGESTFEVFYTRQSAELEPSAPFTSGPLFDLDIQTLEFGGAFHFEEGKVRPFIAGGLGYTLYSPDAAGSDDEGGLTLGMGGGVRLRAGARVDLRFEGRAHVTFMSDNADLFCTNGSCFLRAEGSVIWQFEGLGGVVIRF